MYWDDEEKSHYNTNGIYGLVICFLLALLVQPVPVSAFVYENSHEFFTAADFDGDGRVDALVLDRVFDSYPYPLPGG